jgi:hypothetical protein
MSKSCDRKLYLAADEVLENGRTEIKLYFISHFVPGGMNACFQWAIAFEKEEMDMGQLAMRRLHLLST